jgi:type IV secretory pathway VirJ component
MNKVLLTLCIFLYVNNEGYTRSTHEVLANAVFGEIQIYRPSGPQNSVTIFVSGDGGWNAWTDDEVKFVAGLGSFVVGIDIRQYASRLKKQISKCFYLASDLETLSIMLQKKYKFPQYYKPILIGYSSGATLVYGALAQAPANTFKGAIALGFCPDMDINKPLCEGSGLKSHSIREGQSYYLEQTENITAPFIVLQGIIDRVCPYDQIKEYMEKLKTGQLIALPNVGHGFAKPINWHPQFLEAFKKVLSAPTYAEQKSAQNALLQSQHIIKLPGDLPITLIPAPSQDTMPMVFMLSGDGGWTGFDQSLCEFMAEKGLPVVGLDVQKYFWNFKTPDEAASDIAKAVLHYMQQWNKNKFILAGYSFGACVVPFIARKFPDALKTKLLGVYSLSPDERADFEIHYSDMLSMGNSHDTYDVLEEIKKIRELNPVCIFGDEESTELREHFGQTGAEILTVPGSHHYNNNPALVAGKIINDIEKAIKQADLDRSR